jgi:hypothetical protein
VFWLANSSDLSTNGSSSVTQWSILTEIENKGYDAYGPDKNYDYDVYVCIEDNKSNSRIHATEKKVP